MVDMDGWTAIVTGSSSGIGKAIAQRYAEQGANVVVNSRSEERAARESVAVLHTSLCRRPILTMYSLPWLRRPF